MHPLELNISQLLAKHSSLKKKDRIIVGVSAGPDSLALLHILAVLKESMEWQLWAVYVDHGLRPTEVPAEIETVQEYAAGLRIPTIIRHVDTGRKAADDKVSLEHAARDLRYLVLREVKEEEGADWLAVGHHADDQVEEILLRLLRGSSRKALSGMLLEQNGILRPFLHTNKQDIYSYLDDNGVQYCTDSSNADPVFLRNRIRNHLLPLLEREYDPGIRKALLKTAANLSEDEDFLAETVGEILKEIVIKYDRGSDGQEPMVVIDRLGFNKYHPALQRRAIESLLWKIQAQPRYEHILAVINSSMYGRKGSELHLSKGLRVEVGKTTLSFFYPKGKTSWRGTIKASRP